MKTEYQYNYKDVRKIVSELYDKGDPWGSTMCALFDVAGELHFRSAPIPTEWEYRPGGTSDGDPREEESAYYEDFKMADTEALVKLGRVLDRHSGRIRAAGRDY